MDTTATVLQIILGAVFILSGGLKVAGIPMQVENFRRYGYPQWFRSFTGLVEVVGALGMFIGLAVDEIAVAGAAILAVTMVGAFITDLLHSPRFMVIPPVVFLVMSVIVGLVRLD